MCQARGSIALRRGGTLRARARARAARGPDRAGRRGRRVPWPSSRGRRGSARAGCWPRRAGAPSGRVARALGPRQPARGRVRVRRRAPAASRPSSRRRSAARRCWRTPRRPPRRSSATCDGRCGGASFAALHGLFWLVLNLAEERPLLLAVDDLHWCDRPSLLFFAYLARRLEGQPILLLAGAARGRARHRRGAARRARSTTLPSRASGPGPLSDDAVAAFDRRSGWAPRPRPPSRRACHDATGGNPLLLSQLVTALAQRGRAAGRRARRPRPGHRPAGRVAHGAAAAGAPAARGARRSRGRSPSSATAPGCPPSAELAGVDEAARRRRPRARWRRPRSCAPSAPLAFVHPLVRDAVYHDLPAAERELEHARAADAASRRAARRRSRSPRSSSTPRRAASAWIAELLLGGGPCRDARGRGRQRRPLPAACAGRAAAGRRAGPAPARARRGRGAHAAAPRRRSTWRWPTRRSTIPPRAPTRPACSAAR